LKCVIDLIYFSCRHVAGSAFNAGIVQLASARAHRYILSNSGKQIIKANESGIFYQIEENKLSKQMNQVFFIKFKKTKLSKQMNQVYFIKFRKPNYQSK
jgi:hypothetical protein